jgi:hypothetical protein
MAGVVSSAQDDNVNLRRLEQGFPLFSITQTSTAFYPFQLVEVRAKCGNNALFGNSSGKSGKTAH